MPWGHRKEDPPLFPEPHGEICSVHPGAGLGPSGKEGMSVIGASALVWGGAAGGSLPVSQSCLRLVCSGQSLRDKEIVGNTPDCSSSGHFHPHVSGFSLPLFPMTLSEAGKSWWFPLLRLCNPPSGPHRVVTPCQLSPTSSTCRSPQPLTSWSLSCCLSTASRPLLRGFSCRVHFKILFCCGKWR